MSSSNTTALTFTRREVASTGCPHASSTRSGRVVTLPQAYTSLLAVAPIGAGVGLGDAPRFIDVPPRAPWMVLERPGGRDGMLEIRSHGGELALARQMTSCGAHALARDEGYVIRDAVLPWSGAAAWDDGFGLHQAGELLAIALDDGVTRSIITSPDGPVNDRPQRPDFTRVEASRLSADGRSALREWAVKFDEPGVGGIDGDGRVFVALASGRFQVLAPDCDEDHEPVVLLDTSIEPSATDLSIVPPYTLLLYGGGDAGSLALARGRSYQHPRIDAIGADGAVAWRKPLPFSAGQPPLDGNGRIYVVGNGIVALDMTGAELWRHESSIPLRAATFGDGSLVVVRDQSLYVIAPDGSVRSSLQAPEALTSYPAIDAVGDVWIASATTLGLMR